VRLLGPADVRDEMLTELQSLVGGGAA
jgi:hypothetical protein